MRRSKGKNLQNYRPRTRLTLGGTFTTSKINRDSALITQKEEGDDEGKDNKRRRGSAQTVNERDDKRKGSSMSLIRKNQRRLVI